MLKNTSVFCSALTCALPATKVNAAAPTETKRPNILIIQCDQQRYDCLGYTGNPIVKTPNIDRLAAQGMQFTRAYTPIPTSCPARQCLLSGQWPEQYGGLWNYDITLPVRLFDSDTWTERLQDEGYRTGYVGNGTCTRPKPRSISDSTTMSTRHSMRHGLKTRENACIGSTPDRPR